MVSQRKTQASLYDNNQKKSSNNIIKQSVVKRPKLITLMLRVSPTQVINQTQYSKMKTA